MKKLVYELLTNGFCSVGNMLIKSDKSINMKITADKDGVLCNFDNGDVQVISTYVIKIQTNVKSMFFHNDTNTVEIRTYDLPFPFTVDLDLGKI